MFVGHYGVSFAAKRYDPGLPLWLLFLAVQLLDVAWAPLVLLGIEKVRIVPGITRSNPLDLYYMPFTHSLVAAVLWSVGAAALYKLVASRGTRGSAAVLGAAVFSHWLLDSPSIGPTSPSTATRPKSAWASGTCLLSPSASRRSSCSEASRCASSRVSSGEPPSSSSRS